MLKTPVLFIIFNRLDTTKQVFAKIREIQPLYLFIAADGPRKTHFGEKEKCETVREWVLSNIDWQCEVHTLFREDNLGCGKAVSQAITWFFDNVEQGIILEDDCIPDISFFNYCEILLEHYKSDQRIMHITGYNPQEISHFRNNASYCFVPIEVCWGWASWRRAWQCYRFDIKNTDSVLCSHPYFRHRAIWKYWQSIFHAMEIHKIDTWDYQWTYAILKNNGYCIVPQKNLIQNIGFTADSTHFDGSNNSFMKPSHTLSETIIHPKQIKYDRQMSDYTDRLIFNIDCRFYTVIKEILSHFKHIVKKSIKKGIQNIFYRLIDLESVKNNNSYMTDVITNLEKIRCFPPYKIAQAKIGDYTYISINSIISYTEIGKFCSIGPNFFCGWGIHPTNFISTSPMFYSTMEQNGFSLCSRNKITERKQITIGNDVFIGANVTILDGVTIGDGAVIGAGAVVVKDIPPYAVAVGVPAKVIKYRFTPEQIKALLEIKWWDFDETELQNVEKYCDNPDMFIKLYTSNSTDIT